MAELTDFQEIIFDLPDRRKLTVQRLIPITNDDSFAVTQTPNRGASSVVGFVEQVVGRVGGQPAFYFGSADPEVITTASFYVGSQDFIRVQNQKGVPVIYASLYAGRRRSFIEETS